MLLLELEKDAVVNAKDIASIWLNTFDHCVWYINVEFKNGDTIDVQVPSEQLARVIYDSLIDWLAGNENGYLSILNAFGLNDKE